MYYTSIAFRYENHKACKTGSEEAAEDAFTIVYVDVNSLEFFLKKINSFV